MDNFIFKDLAWLWLLLLLPLVFWLRGRKKIRAVLVPFASRWFHDDILPPSRIPSALFLLGVVVLAFGLARPQIVEGIQEVQRKGYDIMLAIDLSGSMLAEDYGRDINRLDVVKPIVEDFVKKRPGDRIGLVVFAEGAYTLAPLTFDHEWLLKQAMRVEPGLIAQNRTAIGDGLGLALARLTQSITAEDEAERLGAFVILLTDGSNNSGILQPLKGAEIARKRGIKVYTIGAGKSGPVPMPYTDEFGFKNYRLVESDLDEDTLIKIAQTTGGEFYRATEADIVKAAFDSIDRQQKVDFESKIYHKSQELFPWWVWPGVALCLLGVIFLPTGRASHL